jgi:type VI secretion system VasD/TssJ family lipoprotein
VLDIARQLTLVCALTLAASSCASSQRTSCDRDEQIALHVHPAKRLNPDRAGLPRSVVLRLYQLDDARRFTSRSFEQLWLDPAAQRGVALDQVIAIPGRDQAHALRRDPKASFLAVAANFRERSGDSSWRALVRLPEPRDPCGVWPKSRTRPLEIVLADYALTLR